MRVDAEVTEDVASPGRWQQPGSLRPSSWFVAVQPVVTTTTFVGLSPPLSTALVRWHSSRYAPSTRRGRRRVGADSRGLSVDGELVLPRQTILQARVKDEVHGGHSVIVEARGCAVADRACRFPAARSGARRHPRTDAARRRRVRRAPPWAHRMRWLTIVLTTSPWIFVNLLRHMPGWSILVVMGLYGVIALPMVLPQKVAVGEDGILLRWASRRRFVPFALLRDARATALGVEPRAGRRARDRDPPHAPGRRRVGAPRGDARTHRGRSRAAPRARARRRRSVARARRPRARGVGRGDEHPRHRRRLRLPHHRDPAGAALGRPREPGRRSVGAPRSSAIALRARLDDDERDRLLSIGQKSASPRLRVALDAVA